MTSFHVIIKSPQIVYVFRTSSSRPVTLSWQHVTRRT